MVEELLDSKTETEPNTRRYMDSDRTILESHSVMDQVTLKYSFVIIRILLFCRNAVTILGG